MAANLETVNTDLGQKDTRKHFGSFKVTLAEILTFEIVIRLATLFGYPPRIIAELERKENRSHLMIRCMEERGQIQPTDITLLLNGLKRLDLVGTESTVRKLFEEHTGIRDAGERCSFVDNLRKRYSLWYNKIQPIPYIRERIYCVNDVYVEGCIQVVKSAEARQGGSPGGVKEEPKSFSDIFDNNKIFTNRILLEGDPGYGKSTFTLQAAYEWCAGNESSPLKLFDVFILLPLRLLRSISSIFEGIRLVLMPAETILTDGDIKHILVNCKSGIIVLDGYDEYPDKGSGCESDVIKIIQGTMFPNFKVVLTSRSSSLPRDLDPSTVTLKLTGFNETSMYEYIKLAVTGGNRQEAQKIKDILNSSPVLADICQVPIFCVMFAHITKDQTHSVARLSSVTSFFQYIMLCFYSHMRKKQSETDTSVSLPHYQELNKLAFDSLAGETQQIIWPKKSFIETVGNECFKVLSTIGILVEENILEVNKEAGLGINHHVKYQEFVRFYHQLFAEWYAGIYLSSYAGGFWPIWLNYTLNKINPVDLQYVFRFASGLNKKACGRIVRYLQGLNGGTIFASLCLFEDSVDQSRLTDMVRGLCSGGMTIRSTDSKLLQRSNIQLLDIAARNEISVSYLMLDKSIVHVDSDKLTLNNGLPLPALKTVQKLEVKTEMGDEYTTETFFKFLSYCQRCENLNYVYFIECLLPVCIAMEPLSSTSASFKCKVFWRLFKDDFGLDSSTGKWKLTTQQSSSFDNQDDQISPALCSAIVGMFSGKLTLLNDDNEERKRTMTILIKTAIKHSIPISCLEVDKTLLTNDKRGIKIKIGCRLPILLETLEVREKAGIELKQESMLRIIRNIKNGPKLKKLTFSGCLLPLSFNQRTFSSAMQEKDFQVCWRPLNLEFGLDFTSGHWNLNTPGESVSLNINDKQTLSDMCKEPIYLKKSDSKQRQKSTILLLDIASNHGIPIPNLHLKWSYKGINGDNIKLASGLFLSGLSSIEKITINGDGGVQRVSEEELTGLIAFGMKSSGFKEIRFMNCKLPPSINPDSVSDGAKTGDVKVISANEALLLGMENGKWKEPDDIQTITTICSGTVSIRNDSSKSTQQSIMDLLVKASSHDIPISWLVLVWSFDKIDEDDLNIILKSGLQIPSVSSLEIMTIQMEKGKKMKEEEVTKLLNYLQQNKRLRLVGLMDCVLPSTMRLGPSASILQSRNVNVFWCPQSNKEDQFYWLDLLSGSWKKVGEW